MQEIRITPPRILTPDEVLTRLIQCLATIELTNKKVLIICEDVTRATPIHTFFPRFLQFLRQKVETVTVLFALGTHRPMTFPEMLTKLGVTEAEAGQIQLINHNAFDDQQLVDIGLIESIPLKLHRSVAEHDLVLSFGCVMPHRVMGFSGGAKYLCPGISNKASIDYSHWKSTLFSEQEILAQIENPVRHLLDEVTQLVEQKLPATFVSVNFVNAPPAGISEVFIGDFYSSYREAAKFATELLVKRVKPCAKLLAIVDDKCVDFWQAAKALYHCGPVVQDGGTIVLRGKLPEKISVTHGALIEQVGYAAPETIQAWFESGQLPSQVVASQMVRVGHHLKRIKIFLASENIDEALCRRVNLGYLNPESLTDFDQFDYVVYSPADLVLIPEYSFTNLGGDGARG